MKRIKSIIAVILIFLCISSFTEAFAYCEVSYNNLIDPQFVTDTVEDQGESSDCLYYALFATAESYVKKYYNKSVNFSEAELIETLNEEKDFETVVNGFRNNPDLPLEGEENSPYSVSEVEVLQDTNPLKIKRAVKENGAVTAVFSVCDDGMNCGAHYKKDSFMYYCPANECSDDLHAVSVIGWDDNYKGGCWICKNSYGYDYGYAGFFYLSYNQEIHAAVKMVISESGETVGPVIDETWDSNYITAVFVQVDAAGHAYAYGVSAEDKRFDLGTVEKSAVNNYLVVVPPDNAFFDSDTVLYYNGDKSAYGFTGSNEEGRYEFENTEVGMVIKIESKEPGGYEIIRFESTRFDMGFIKLTYDNNSTRMIFKSDFEENGIEVMGENYSAEKCSQYGFETLHELSPNHKYTVLKFDKTYKFNQSAVDNQRYYILICDDYTYLAVDSETFLPEVALKNMSKMITVVIEAFLSIFSNIAFSFSTK